MKSRYFVLILVILFISCDNDTSIVDEAFQQQLYVLGSLNVYDTTSRVMVFVSKTHPYSTWPEEDYIVRDATVVLSFGGQSYEIPYIPAQSWYIADSIHITETDLLSLDVSWQGLNVHGELHKSLRPPTEAQARILTDGQQKLVELQLSPSILPEHSYFQYWIVNKRNGYYFECSSEPYQEYGNWHNESEGGKMFTTITQTVYSEPGYDRTFERGDTIEVQGRVYSLSSQWINLERYEYFDVPHFLDGIEPAAKRRNYNMSGDGFGILFSQKQCEILRCVVR